MGPCNMDEFGMGSATAFSRHGACVNPRSPPVARALAAAAEDDGDDGAQRTEARVAAAMAPSDSRNALLTAGGSSGGSAAAVAVGAVPAALGSDTGGSVRLPAAFCGVVGFKPSYGRISRWGLIAYASSLDTIGVLAGSVGDAALVYDLCKGTSGDDDDRDDTCLRIPGWKLAGTSDVGDASMSRVLAAAALADAGAQTDCTAPRRVASTSAYLTARAAATAGGVKPAALDAWRSAVSAGRLDGLRVGIPREYSVAELPPSVKQGWENAAAALAEAGAQVVPVSLPHTADALAAYYIIATAEAASNLSRYDGVRYGHRSAAEPAPAAAASRSSAAARTASANAAAALHELYTRSRSEGFGREVQRRIMMGNVVMSRGGRAEFYDAARDVRRRVTLDFDAAFRRRGADCSVADCDTDGGSAAALSPLNAYMASRSACGSAGAAAGVDVLLTPTAPGMPWPVHATDDADPVAMYMNDIMTVPASLAGLPAASVPFGTVPLNGADVVPLGLQVIGRYMDEDTVLRVAAVLEHRAP